MASNDDIRCFEIKSIDNFNVSYQEIAAPADLSAWLGVNACCTRDDDMVSPHGSLRLLLCPIGLEIRPYHPFPETSFQTLANTLRLEKNYLGSESRQVPYNMFEVPLDNECIGFVIKLGKWDLTTFSLSVVFNPKKMQSSCIVRILGKDDLIRFERHLREMKPSAWYSLFLPLIFLKMQSDEFPEITKIREIVYGIEDTTGTQRKYIRPLGSSVPIGRSIREVWLDPDFEFALGELTAIATDCTSLEYRSEVQLHVINWIRNMHRTMLHASSLLSNVLACKTLEIKLGFMTDWLMGVKTRSAYFGRRVEVQIQTCRNLLAQRDTAINKRTAESSLAMSRYSRMDSEDMRTIAAVTLFFLPGTFVATMFSTSFFDFHKEGQTVSSLVWLYWLVTAVLTAFVFLDWYIFSHQKRRGTLGCANDAP